nr:MAG TPA: hypothetical protein [Caudoviricetes sp.]
MGDLLVTYNIEVKFEKKGEKFIKIPYFSPKNDPFSYCILG